MATIPSVSDMMRLYDEYLQQKMQHKMHQEMLRNQAMSGGLGGSYGSTFDPFGGLYGNWQSNSQVHGGTTQSPDPFHQRALATLAQQATPGRAERSAACPHEGIRAGEIIAYRSWMVRDGELHSTFHKFKWMPGGLECVDGVKALKNGYGFYAFKDEGRARSEAMNEMASVTFAVGSVYIWGEIVEHETGYRSTHAAIKSIDFVNPINTQLLERLRAAYVVPPKPLDSAA